MPPGAPTTAAGAHSAWHLRTYVRYHLPMTPRQLEELAERHSRLLHMVPYLPHPRDGYDAWRRR